MMAKSLGLFAILFVSSSAYAAPKCFCPALCVWNGRDASDFHIVKDVPCDQSL